ncbi:MAG: cold-shock protein [Actinomycetes bacterium]
MDAPAPLVAPVPAPSAETQVDAARVLVDGVVRWFSAEKGYGFLTVAGGDVFVDHRDIAAEGFRCLTPGDSVSCVLAHDPAGAVAREVRVHPAPLRAAV